MMNNLDNSKKYRPKDIATDIRSFSIDLLLHKVLNSEIDLLPSFQRGYNLWNFELKSKLIESILLGFPIPPLYFASNYHEKWLVIDGLQRLWTLKEYVLEQKFPLRGLTVLDELNGLHFNELEKQLQRKVKEYMLHVYIIGPEAPIFVTYDVFQRLNTTGVSFNSQEIRHALNPESTRILSSFFNIFFDELVGKKNIRMKHEELILTYLAFNFVSYDDYQPPLSMFLDQTMNALTSIDTAIIDHLRLQFHSLLKFIHVHIGKQAFRKISNKKSKFNKFLFEVWTVTLANFSEKELESLATKAPIIKDRFYTLLRDPTFSGAITASTASKQSLNTRFHLFKSMFLDLL